MAHQIEAMFSVSETPWHKLGIILKEAPTSALAIQAAGLDWGVELSPIQTADGQPIGTHQATRRMTDKQVLGVVGRGYHPLQNAEAFSFFDPFVEAGEASYETAGSLRGGARIWILAKLNRAPSEILPGDDVLKYVLLSNGHDGSLAVRVGFTPIRVVCANTMACAHSNESSKLVRIRHSEKVAENTVAVREVMDMANASFEATADQLRSLARRAISADDLKKYVKQIFAPRAGDGDEAPGRVLKAVERLIEEGRGADIQGVRGTWWGAYNAVNEYLGYERGNNDEVLLNSLWYGQNANLNDRALQYAYQAAA